MDCIKITIYNYFQKAIRFCSLLCFAHLQKSDLWERCTGSESTHILPTFNEKISAKEEQCHCFSLVGVYLVFLSVLYVAKQKSYPSIPQLDDHEFLTIQ